ncbi:MAG: Ca2+:H+ antiporter [Gaiellales bacterium]|nr:Ca2+:H+ antiporter [Gaiellales bacterium]
MTVRNLTRTSLWALLALGPIVVVLDWLGAVGRLAVFALAATALIPLAWVIGEATENAAYHTGPGVGGFLNATFGNAPELIIALVAVSDGLTDVVRASLVGSVVGNLLLVLGFAMVLGRNGAIDRVSVAISLGLVALATVLLLVASVPGFHADPNRRSLALLAVPIAVVLLLVRVPVVRFALRRERALYEASSPTAETGWPLPVAVAVLAFATLVTAVVTNALVGSLEEFARQARLSEFFVAIVIVAIVGNAAEHGSAVQVARHGEIQLATEISLASSAQVATLLIPLVALVSWTIDPLTLSFRPVELGALAVATVLPALVLARGWTSRRGGVILLCAYACLVVIFAYSGHR